jgi:biopolymer transport protein ExbB
MPGRAAGGLALFVLVALAGGADGQAAGAGLDLDTVGQQARRLAGKASAWYETTPPADRLIWGGLVAAAGLGLGVVVERMLWLRRKGIVPEEFSTRFLERLQDGKLDRGKALDFCELNPSPASRVALAAVRRWGRPVIDLERAVGLCLRVETDRLWRNVGTMRRVAALTPLIGLLGTLIAAGRALSALGADSPAWGPALAGALTPLTAGVAIAILALVAYDGLAGRVETLTGMLDRVGAETIDAIALSLPADQRPSSPGPPRTPHQPIRLEVPNPDQRSFADLEGSLE